MKKMINHLVLAGTLLLAGCGYVSDKPVENIDVYRSEALQTCEIDASKLSDILQSNQEEQIRCLQENFIQFTKYVRAQKPGSISESELSVFVKRFFAGQSESIIKGMSLIFQMNMILLKDDADHISNTKISPLFELLIKVNQEAVVINKILKELDEGKNQNRYWVLRDQFIKSITRLSNAIVSVIEKSPGLDQKLNIKHFVLEAIEKINGEELDGSTFDCFIFLKRALIGGDKEILTTEELKKAVLKMPASLSLVFDTYYAKTENFLNGTDRIKFYLDSIKVLANVLEFNQPDFELVTSGQLTTIAEKVITERDVKKFKPSLEALKEKFIGGKRDRITLVDLKKAIDIAQDAAERIYFNSITYEAYRTTIEVNAPVTNLKQLALPGYSAFSAKRVAELHSAFVDMIQNFRYFRNKSAGIALYSTNILRSKHGVIEASMAKWLSGKVLAAYGHLDQEKNLQLSMDEISTFLLDAKSLLEEFKLWSPNFGTFARNSLLLADLFQQKSNGDMNININEATEYLGMILSAVEVSGRLNERTSEVCHPGNNPDDKVFELECFNKNYFDIILNQLEYKNYFPRLDEYVKNSSPEEVNGYLRGIQGFARDNDAPGVPVNRRDATLVLGAMINIESTFIRFDTNLDNIIDYEELKNAFMVYRASIISIAKLTPKQEKYALPVFLYMASRMQVPKTGTWFSDINFGFFSTCAESDFCRKKFLIGGPIEAKRLNIGKLLYYLVQQSKADPANKKQQ